MKKVGQPSLLEIKKGGLGDPPQGKNPPPTKPKPGENGHKGKE